VNLIRVDGRRVRDVVRIAHKQLQRVRARRQRQCDLSLARAEMQIVLVVRDRVVQGRQIPVDEKMKVSCIRFLRSDQRDPDPIKPETDRGVRANDGAVLEIKELGLRAWRRRSPSPGLGGLGIGGRGEEEASEQRDHRKRIEFHGDPPAKGPLSPCILDDYPDPRDCKAVAERPDA
jgi:hypothetical protein